MARRMTKQRRWLWLGTAAAIAVCVVLFLLSTNAPPLDVVRSEGREEHGEEDSLDFPSDDLSYGVVIDAGSTGSRLFLYSWRSTSDRELIAVQPVLTEMNVPVVMKKSPGLHNFADAPENATEYMRPLLDYAVRYIPLAARAGTPVFILATAGMRLISLEAQSAIMDNLRRELPRVTAMQVLADHIRVIEGKWEGVYSWIAVNYILGRFTLPDSSTTPAVIGQGDRGETRRPRTAGMIDMGGASLQIAFEVEFDGQQQDEVFSVNLGCRESDTRFQYHLFASTFLGYGVNEALRRYEQSLSDQLVLQQRENHTGNAIDDVCMPVNLVKKVHRTGAADFLRRGTGDWDECRSRVRDLLKTGECPHPRCLFNGVRAPPALASLSTIELFGFSEYWYSLEDVLDQGGLYNFTAIAEKSREFCKSRWTSIQAKRRQLAFTNKPDDERLRSQCFKSAWIIAVLHDGFGVSISRNAFRTALHIRDQEVQWTLGAVLYHMRHFPLGESERRKLKEQKRKQTPQEPPGWFSSWLSAHPFALSGGVLLVVIALIAWRQRHSSSGLRRDPSMWGYMMLNNEDSQFTLPSYNRSFQQL